jgi:hypothetical protein
MEEYLKRPLTIGQSQRLIKFLEVLYDLKLISEATFADTAYHFDDFTWELHQFSWEAPPPQWLSGGFR